METDGGSQGRIALSDHQQTDDISLTASRKSGKEEGNRRARHGWVDFKDTAESRYTLRLMKEERALHNTEPSMLREGQSTKCRLMELRHATPSIPSRILHCSTTSMLTGAVQLEH